MTNTRKVGEGEGGGRRSTLAEKRASIDRDIDRRPVRLYRELSFRVSIFFSFLVSFRAFRNDFYSFSFFLFLERVEIREKVDRERTKKVSAESSRVESRRKEGRHVREWMRWSLSLLANNKHTMRASVRAWILDLECICMGWCE